MRIAAGNPVALFAGEQWVGDKDKRHDVVLAGPPNSTYLLLRLAGDVPLVDFGM